MAVRRMRDGSWAVYCVPCGSLIQGGFRTRREAEAYVGFGGED